MVRILRWFAARNSGAVRTRSSQFTGSQFTARKLATPIKDDNDDSAGVWWYFSDMHDSIYCHVE